MVSRWPEAFSPRVKNTGPKLSISFTTTFVSGCCVPDISSEHFFLCSPRTSPATAVGKRNTASGEAFLRLSKPQTGQ